MGLYKFVSGTKAKASEALGNDSESLLLALKNHVRSLIDRAGVYSSDGSDLWGEAYIDASGS